MSINGLQNTNLIINTIDGLTNIWATDIYENGQKLSVAGLVPYTGATQMVDLNNQTIRSTHSATAGADLVNLITLTNAVTYVDNANALTYLNKITSTGQSVFGQVDFNTGIKTNTLNVSGLTNIETIIVSDSNKNLVASNVSITTLSTFITQSTLTSTLTNYPTNTTLTTLLNTKANLTGGNTFTGDQVLNSGILNISSRLLGTPDATVGGNFWIGLRGTGTEIERLALTITGHQTTGVVDMVSIPKVLNLTQPTFNRVLTIGSTGDVVSSTVTPATLAFLDATSSVQTQLDSKLNKSGGTMTGTINLSTLTASSVLIVDGSKNMVSSSISSTKLSYLTDVTSNIQAQLNTKADTSALSNYLPLSGGTLTGDLTLNSTGTSSGVLAKRYYLTARSDNQDDVAGDEKYGPWYGLGESGIPDFTGVPCLAGYAGVALRTSTGIFIMKDDGAVGIGTTNVIGRHNIAYLGSADFQTLQNTNYSANQFINQRFMFGKNNASNVSAYVQASLNANDETDLLFYVYGSGLNERLRIKGNGNIYANASVGIGESAPSAPLHVKASGGSNPSANGIYVYNTTNSAGQDAIVSVRTAGSSGGNPYISFDIYGEAGWAWGMDNADNSMKLSSSWSSLTSSTKMTINSLGRVGIGCGPTAPLTVGSVTIVDGATTPGVYQPGCIYTDVNWGMLFRGAVAANIAHMRWDNFGGATLMKIQNTGVLNFTGGGTGYAVESGLTTRPGALVIGNISNDYGGGWQAGLMMECQNTTEISCHDSGLRVTSFIYYDGANRMYMGRDIGHGVTPVSFKGKVAINGEADTTAQLCITNPNGSITHFGYSGNENYIRGTNTYIDTESYFATWIRITNNNTGIYWQNLGRGIASPEIVGNSYGNIATYGGGRNGWAGYGLADRHCLMVNGNQWGIHDNIHSWIIRGDGFYDRKVYLAGNAVLISRNWDIFMVHMNLENTGSGYFYVNQGAGYGIASDSRIKQNIEEISSASSLVFIKGLKPSSFCMKNTCPTKQKTADGKDVEYEEAEFCCCAQEGFIAQNVLESAIQAGISRHVCNHWYEYEEEMKKPVEEQTLTDKNTLGVNDRPILSHTVNVVKHLLNENETLKEEIKQLKDIIYQHNELLKKISERLK